MRGEPELPYLRFHLNLKREEKLHQIKDLAKYSNFHHNSNRRRLSTPVLFA